MNLSTTLIKVNGSLLPKLKTYDVSYEDLTVDAGRNMSGDLVFTHVGTFPKITLEFAATTENEMSIIANLFKNPTFSVEYYDVISKSTKTQDFYKGGFKPSLFRKDIGLYNAFGFNIIAVKKMS